MNPYFSLGAMFALGLRGIEKKMALPFPPVGHPDVTPSTLPKLATSLEAATATFSARKSVARECFGDEVSPSFLLASSLRALADSFYRFASVPVRDTLRGNEGRGGCEVQADGDELGGGEVLRTRLEDGGVREQEASIGYSRIELGFKVSVYVPFDEDSLFSVERGREPNLKARETSRASATVTTPTSHLLLLRTSSCSLIF